MENEPQITPLVPTSMPQPKADEPMAQEPKRNYLPIIIAIVVTALIVSGVFYGIAQMKPKEVAVAPTPTPTLMATPTPIRQPSAIAGTPEFIQFQAAVATLSAAIAGYSAQDPSLTPPTLVLPLGFSR